jgi:hypothetical protein
MWPQVVVLRGPRRPVQGDWGVVPEGVGFMLKEAEVKK